MCTHLSLYVWEIYLSLCLCECLCVCVCAHMCVCVCVCQFSPFTMIDPLNKLCHILTEIDFKKLLYRKIPWLSLFHSTLGTV